MVYVPEVIDGARDRRLEGVLPQAVGTVTIPQLAHHLAFDLAHTLT